MSRLDMRTKLDITVHSSGKQLTLKLKIKNKIRKLKKVRPA